MMIPQRIASRYTSTPVGTYGHLPKVGRQHKYWHVYGMDGGDHAALYGNDNIMIVAAVVPRLRLAHVI